MVSLTTHLGRGFPQLRCISFCLVSLILNNTRIGLPSESMLPDDELTSDEAESTEDSRKNQKPMRRNFNPMVFYFRAAIVILISYFVFYAFGYPLLILFMLFMEISLLRGAWYILSSYSYGFVRKAAYFNAGQSIVYLIVLAINGFSITQSGVPLILPEIGGLTLLCPLLIVAALYGITNIQNMYVPDLK